MSKVKQNIEQVTKLVNESVSSVFSKEDVIKLLKRIDETDTNEVNDKIEISREWLIDKLEDLKTDITGEIDSNSIEDVCDLDDIQLTLEGREISIDTGNVYFNGDSINDSVNSAIDSFIDDINDL